MRSAEQTHVPRKQSALISLCWLVLVVMTTAVLAGLALPHDEELPNQARDLFRPEWLVLATLVVGGIFRASRACWLVALPAVAITAAQLLYIADSGFERLDTAGYAGGWVWLAVAGVQLVLVAVAGLAGAIGSVRDRRWERFVLRRLGSDAEALGRRFDIAA